MRRAAAALTALLVAHGLTACDEFKALLPVNSSPPEYVKDVVAYKEGSDALMLYIVLADSRGAMTSADGTLEIRIEETDHVFRGGELIESHTTLYATKKMVSQHQFRHATLGRGAFEHDGIIYVAGRIPYYDFERQPKEHTGRIVVTFTPAGGRPMTGDESVFF